MGSVCRLNEGAQRRGIGGGAFLESEGEPQASPSRLAVLDLASRVGLGGSVEEMPRRGY
jgi:hypothetical protein